MDAYEATKIVLTRIQSLDPDNASKIMGYILIQDTGDNEMIRLAFGPETVLISLMNQAKTHLGLSSNTSRYPTTSPRIMIPNNNNGGFLSCSSPSSPWSGGSPVFSRTPPLSSSLSYAAVVNSNGVGVGSVGSPVSEYCGDQWDPHVISPSGRSVDSVSFCDETNNNNINNSGQQNMLHRRSCSVNDVFVDDGDGGGGGCGCWRPCMYFARGFCKNGSSCKFVHGGGTFGESLDVGSVNGVNGAGVVMASSSPGKIECFDEILRVKALQQQQQQQQRIAAASQFMGHHPFAYNKCINFFNDNQRSTAAALMISDEFHKYGRTRPDRNDFAAMIGGGNSNSCSRQIYLTFPADSTFKEEDVSNYFSMYGPVQDVRIPYQQKRMFGFVTFVYPETVKLILAKGNPHFVCDSRVLVKPYKEKGKIPDKKQLQQSLDREELSACLSPSGLESSELYDIPFGARMFYNSREMMLRRKIEQDAELQQAIELQGRRLINLHLMDTKNRNHDNDFQLSLSPENNGIQEPAEFPPNSGEKIPQDISFTNNGIGGCCKEQASNTDYSDCQGSLEHILPDNLFASPTKSAAEQQTTFSSVSAEAEVSSAAAATAAAAATVTNSIPMLPTTSTFNMATLKSCYFQMPRFTSGQEATET